VARSNYESFNEQLVADFRAHGGKVSGGPFKGRDLLLLTTKGAKSGVERTSPVAYTKDGDRYVIVASKGGAPTNPSWYHNLRTHPVVTLEVGPRKFKARAKITSGDERRRLYDRHAETHPGFKDYLTKTTREIPVIILEPE